MDIMNQETVAAADTVVHIHRSGIFTIQEARALLPIVYKVTKSYSERVEVLKERLDGVGEQNQELCGRIEDQICELVNEWSSKVQRLGVLPKGMWIADFDSGEGYFCWKFPERSLDFWHKYEDGYTKRIRLN